MNYCYFIISSPQDEDVLFVRVGRIETLTGSVHLSHSADGTLKVLRCAGSTLTRLNPCPVRYAVRDARIELASRAWEAHILPLN